MIPCSQCGQLPERRQDPQSGLLVYACPGCRHRGEITSCERGALASWEQINAPDLPAHGCRSSRPPRFFQKGGAWGARCPGCGFEEAGYGSIGGAAAGWVRALR